VYLAQGKAIIFTGLERARGFQKAWRSQISRQSAHEGGKVVSPTHRPPLLNSVRGWVDSRAIVRPEGLCQWKIPMTSSGIELMTFWLVVQCSNQLPHRVAPFYLVTHLFKNDINKNQKFKPFKYTTHNLY
jgi:hypothetical protein